MYSERPPELDPDQGPGLVPPLDWGHGGSDMSCKSIQPGELQRSLQAGQKLWLVDVRTPAEFSAGSIEGAQNMDVKNTEFKTMAAKLDKKRPVAVYCLSGIRSARAAGILQELGFKKIYNLDGGYTAWTK